MLTPGGSPKRTLARIDNALGTGETERVTAEASPLGRGAGAPAGVPPHALHAGFLGSHERFPDRPALEVDGARLTYAELHDRAAAIAAALDHAGVGDDPPLTAVYAYRTATAYAGVLAALFRGHGYVPLNRTFPPERTAALLRRVGCRALVVDEASAEHLETVLEGIDETLALVLPDVADVSALAARWPGHVVLGAADLVAPPADWEPGAAAPDAIAYLLFTSGSTGVPKGVAVSHGSIVHFLDVVRRRYALRETDRFTQLFELVFDLSLFDLFGAFACGGAVCCPTRGDVLMADQWVRANGISVWFSVPSQGLLMKRMRRLVPGALPSLRVALFCGEALPSDVAGDFAAAAPGAVVENLYGPTETTLCCTTYRWREPSSRVESQGGVVPIGEALEGTSVAIVDDELRVLPDGEPGELIVGGPQVALGYWRDAARTAERFVRPPALPGVHYRTGDRVVRDAPGAPIRFLGRMDHQIKLRGHRIELGDVEAALRDAAGIPEVVALGWPVRDGRVDGITGIVAAPSIDAAAVKARLAALLPDYMVPAQLLAVPAFPLTLNGKIDRKALLQQLEAPRHGDHA